MGLPEDVADAVRALMTHSPPSEGEGWVLVLYRPEYRQDDHVAVDAMAWHRDWFTMTSLGQPPGPTEIVRVV